MKTLDELINALERCLDTSCDGNCKDCAYDTGRGICGDEREMDTLHYLKEYREVKRHLACMDSGEIRGEATQKERK